MNSLEPMLSRASTRIWLPSIVLVSGRSTYVPDLFVSLMWAFGFVLNLCSPSDSPCCGGRENRGYSPTLHQTTSDPQAQVPSSPSHSEGPLNVCRAPPNDLLDYFLLYIASRCLSRLLGAKFTVGCCIRDATRRTI